MTPKVRMGIGLVSLIALAWLLLAGSGCAFVYLRDIDVSKGQQAQAKMMKLRLGTTTAENAIGLFGKPDERLLSADREVLTYEWKGIDLGKLGLVTIKTGEKLAERPVRCTLEFEKDVLVRYSLEAME